MVKTRIKDIKFDCRYFDGAKPCAPKKVCRFCPSYSPVKERILIIKLGSSGDVLRTTSLLAGLKKRYPYSYISWVVAESAQELLDLGPHLDRILVFGLESALALLAEEFDLVISLDKAVEAAALATLISAKKKYGFGLNKSGKVRPFNKGAEYSFLIGVDDELKFRKNKKTYQELIFECCKLKFTGEDYELKLNKKELDFARGFFKNYKVQNGDIVIGINTGAGKVFANKNLAAKKIVDLIKGVKEELGGKILLLGGPLEEKTHGYILKRLGHAVIDGGCGNSLKEFCALINGCSLVITADTLSLHIAVALKKPVVVLFGPTAHQEIELYRRGKKIISDAKCAPCYKNECGKTVTCMDRIELEEIVKAAGGLIADKLLKR